MQKAACHATVGVVEDPVEAIAHPQRRAMLRLVLDGERAVADLVERTGLSQPATSQHLRVLRDAGLVRVRADGPRRLYRVDPDGLARLRRELDGFWLPALDALKVAAEEEEVQDR
ncbi:MAG: metalloregulator ArsR/SmtB family transcription factor [Actinomycetota bacterium]